MDIAKEKDRVLTTQDVYDILNFSIQQADNDGFVSSYIFERAMYCYAAILLYEDRKEELISMISTNLLDAWDSLIKDGTIENMFEFYNADCDYLSYEGESWFYEYVEYATSMRGIMDTFQTTIGDASMQMTEQFQAAMKNPQLQEVNEIADKWGMNNKLDDNSLFSE